MAKSRATNPAGRNGRRKAARSRLDVSQDVRREVVEAQRRALLNLRDGGRINDRTYVGLLLELDRAHLATASSPA